ncbi:hypothetical protein WH47_05239 [Habropoda laboriosa]|uniref:Uncharacterized protein n=1 Tax=Habropoda laboriosa TaxID=597456 RepID=A0A0L7RKA5_9HYME|nr:hypothetical protein WH47_05239 [Habropoda laboriosa]
MRALQPSKQSRDVGGARRGSVAPVGEGIEGVCNYTSPRSGQKTMAGGSGAPSLLGVSLEDYPHVKKRLTSFVYSG